MSRKIVLGACGLIVAAGLACAVLQVRSHTATAGPTSSAELVLVVEGFQKARSGAT